MKKTLLARLLQKLPPGVSISLPGVSIDPGTLAEHMLDGASAADLADLRRGLTELRDDWVADFERLQSSLEEVGILSSAAYKQLLEDLENVLRRPPPPSRSAPIQRYGASFSASTGSMGTDAVLRDARRTIQWLISHAFLDVRHCITAEPFVYLMSLDSEKQSEEGDWEFTFELYCHFSAFLEAFERRLRNFFADPDGMGQDEDINIRSGCKWAKFVPYRIWAPGPKQVTIECVEEPYYLVKFPMQTSDLLVVLSAMLTGKALIHDDVNFGEPHEIAFVRWMGRVTDKRHFSWLDIAVDANDPERWTVKSGGVSYDN